MSDSGKVLYDRFHRILLEAVGEYLFSEYLNTGELNPLQNMVLLIHLKAQLSKNEIQELQPQEAIMKLCILVRLEGNNSFIA